MIYFISDTHFNHYNIIKYCQRPFQDVSEMNNAIINNWNNIVKDEDIVYHLGDFALSKSEEVKKIFEKLKGNIFLIRGNHDGKSIKYYEDIGFHVLAYALIKLDKYKLILSHYPLQDNLIPQGYINLHGHIHDKKLNENYPQDSYNPDKHLNVSIDVTDYKPLSLKKIIDIRNRNI